jgi:hypothetical protein
MNSIQINAKEIKDYYPKSTRIKERDYYYKIPLINDVNIHINFKRYPKIPKMKLVKKNGESFKLTSVLSYLRNWDEKEPPKIVNVLDELFLIIDSLKNRMIPFTEQCFQGLINMCNDQHPKKIQGVLSVDKGLVSELIIPSNKCSNPDNKISYINFQSSCSLPFDLSYEGTFISRPNGDISKNENLNRVFKRRRFTMLLAYPYDDPNNIKLFDREGNELSYMIKSLKPSL